MTHLLDSLEVFCPDEKCGDRATNTSGTTFHHLRKMILTGRTFLFGDWIYCCPVCGKIKKVKEGFGGFTIE